MGSRQAPIRIPPNGRFWQKADSCRHFQEGSGSALIYMLTLCPVLPESAASRPRTAPTRSQMVPDRARRYRAPSPQKAGSGDSLNVSDRCGCRPKARQMRNTAVWLMPTRRAGAGCVRQPLQPLLGKAAAPGRHCLSTDTQHPGHTQIVGLGSAQASTTRMRCASAWPIPRRCRRSKRCNSTRSAPVSSSKTALGP